MKTTLFTVALATLGCAVLSAQTEGTPAKAQEKPAATEAAANTIPAYIVQVSGKG